MSYIDSNVPMTCAECGAREEGIPSMLSHMFDFHTHYTLKEAQEHVRLWADNVYEEEEIWNMEQAQEYRRTRR